MSSLVNTNAMVATLKQQNFSIKKAKEWLQQQNIDAITADECLSIYSNYKNRKRQINGTIFTVTGSFLGFVSCVLTMLDWFPALNNFFLYGLTSFAVSLAFYGLWLILEK